MQNKNDRKIRIVDFAPEHLDTLVLRDEDARDLAGFERADLAENCRGWRTVLRGNDAAFLYGLDYRGCTVGLHAITSPLVDRMPLFITRLGRGVIRGAITAGARRVETYCHADNRRSLNWLTRSLGMRVEGLLRQCGPDAQDRYVLAVLAEDFAGMSWTKPHRTCGPALSRAEGDGCEPGTTLPGESTSPTASVPTGCRDRASSEKEVLPWAR